MCDSAVDLRHNIAKRSKIMREVTIATVQCETTPDPKTNRLKGLDFCERAARQGAQIICFPEFWVCDSPVVGNFERLIPLAESVPGPTFDLFCQKAKELQMYIVPGTVLEKTENGEYFNTSGLIAPDGTLISRIRKDHPENASGKAEVDFGILPGPGDYPVFDTQIGRIGIPIDMDICSLEVPRIMGLKEAEILFTPMSWDSTVHECVSLYGFASSSVSDAYMVISNRMSFEKRRLGGSGIIWLRDYLARVPNLSEGMAITTVNLDNVKARREEARTRYPYWRRPETYGMLVDPKVEMTIRGPMK